MAKKDFPVTYYKILTGIFCYAEKLYSNLLSNPRGRSSALEAGET